MHMLFRVQSGKRETGMRGVRMIKSKTKFEATLEDLLD